ncbi:extracellular solute-binding protein [Paenibacillus sp. N1-5-1-14]|uniref:ABC transporter substrate-binding protein n=1 Tax=Paenibacillus radicibacter TaxID=2972488 RepID=UPI002158E75D|nr:extracellular solute-binding protein [Paenibacillus radicibacter]MCR8643462.1 extracellular solute-binding protein [Paenibacillus radicibacter]
MKKGIALVAAGALAVGALTGCGGKGDNKAASDQTVIDVFQFKVEFKEQFEKVAKDYEKLHPNVKINISTVGGGDDYGAALKSKFASGAEPAIFNVGGPQDVADWKGKLADVSDTEAFKKALKGTLSGVTVDGKTYGLPFAQEGYGFLYNKEVFKKAGIDPSTIKSYKALEDAAKLLDSKKKELGLDSVTAFPAKETWVTGLHLSNPFFSAEFGEDIAKAYNAKEIQFKYQEAFKKVLDLQQNYSVQPTVSLDYSRQVEELFSNGKVAFIQQGNWVYGSIEGIDKEFAANNVGILPLPVEGFKEDSIPVGVPMYWAVNETKSDAVKKESKAFIDWLYTSDAGKKTVLEDFKFIPAYDGFETDKIADPISKEIYKFAQEGKTMGWVFMGYPSAWGMDKLGADIQQYVSGKLPWDQLVQNAKDTWKAAR